MSNNNKSEMPKFKSSAYKKVAKGIAKCLKKEP